MNLLGGDTLLMVCWFVTGMLFLLDYWVLQYLDAKQRQRPHWTDPYLYETGYVGLTNVHPIYETSDRGQVFFGVLAIDYKCESIHNNGNLCCPALS